MAKSYEEIASEIVKKNSVHWCGCGVCQRHRDQCVSDIAAAIREAVEAERKRCSDLAKEGGEKISEYIDSGF